MRTSIIENRFPEFVKEFMIRYFKDKEIPEWIKPALQKVNIHL